MCTGGVQQPRKLCESSLIQGVLFVRRTVQDVDRYEGGVCYLSDNLSRRGQLWRSVVWGTSKIGQCSNLSILCVLLQSYLSIRHRSGNHFSVVVGFFTKWVGTFNDQFQLNDSYDV